MERHKQNILTRCRTGCMRCRLRRRKCDEGKPRCRNCIDRNFECRYGTQLTFLTKNARTVRESEIRNSPTSYRAIQFVNEEPEGCNETNNDQAEDLPPHTDLAQQPQPTGSNILNETRDGEVPARPEPAFYTSDEHVHPVLSDKDESAIAGLLALGMNEPDLGLPDLLVASPKATMMPSNMWCPSPSTTQHAQGSCQSNRGTISPTEVQDLLRHYRYEVAPWLDICDLGQSFGTNVLQLAMDSPSILKSILELSETSLKQLYPQRPPTEGNRFVRHADPGVQVDLISTALRIVLDQVKDSIQNISDSWNYERECNHDLLLALSSNGVARDLNAAIYWLFVRFDAAAALASDSDMCIPLPPSFPNLRQGDIVADPFEMIYYYAYRPLWICARAIQFRHNEEVSPVQPPLDIWMQLVEALQQWHRDRPRHFEPLLELEIDDELAGPERTFPVVLYANGAGLFGNQLYHTAMLLLLQNRPRTAQIANIRSASMSPLWHAQRICSIALHNDHRASWDICLLASFLLAARGMTHEFQQQEVMRGFDRIHTLTGWDVANCVQSLREDWGLLDKT